MISRRSLFVGMAGASFLAGSPKAKDAGRDKTFDLYDSLLFTGKPDLSRYGLKRARTVYESELWPPKRSAMPNETAVRSKARAVLAEGITAAVPVVLDVGAVFGRCPVGYISYQSRHIQCGHQHSEVGANHWLVQE